MGKIKSIREAGWAQLGGKWGLAATLTIVYVLIAICATAMESAFWESSLISTLLLVPMQYAYSIVFLDDLRSGKKIEIASLFEGYSDYLRIVGTYLLSVIYVFLWSLLLIIPGIVKGIEYSQTVYVLKDNPELSFNAAIERSCEMMKGHRWEYFCLYFSFIGWILLEIITLGIASLWVNPYMSATFANYYEKLKTEYENNKIAA